MRAKIVKVTIVNDGLAVIFGKSPKPDVETYLYLPGDKIAAIIINGEVVILESFKIPESADVEIVEITNETTEALRRIRKDRKTVLSAIEKFLT